MKEDQTSIYYLVGSNGIDELKRSPFVEMLDAQGYEVIFFDDPLDEYVTDCRRALIIAVRTSAPVTVSRARARLAFVSHAAAVA